MAKKVCRADVRKAIINTAYKEMIKNNFTPVEGADDIFYIKDSQRVVDNKANSKRSEVLAETKGKILEIHTKFKNRVKAVLMDTDDQSPVQIRIVVDPEYVEHEFAKLPEERQNEVFVDMSKDDDFFSDEDVFNQPIFEQDLKQDYDSNMISETNNLFNYTKEEITPEVKYQFKSVDNISKNLNKVNKWLSQFGFTDQFWNKVQQDLQIPKDQITLLKESKGNTIEEKLSSFAANYGYQVPSSCGSFS